MTLKNSENAAPNKMQASKQKVDARELVDAWWRKHIAGSALARYTPCHNVLAAEIPGLITRLNATKNENEFKAAAREWLDQRIAGSRIARHQASWLALQDAIPKLQFKE